MKNASVSEKIEPDALDYYLSVIIIDNYFTRIFTLAIYLSIVVPSVLSGY